MADSKRYLGLELSGAKNQKTALAAIEFYPKEKKVFLLDIYERIAAREDQNSDEALLDLLEEVKGGPLVLGVNVPLELPPCIGCTRRACVQSGQCQSPSVKWMREMTKKAARNPEVTARIREFTPYTQRPVELWVRYQILPQLSDAAQFEVDETLGGNKAPLTARMHYLKRRLKNADLLEVWPKLTISILGERLGLNRRTLRSYRHLEEGAHARTEILEALSHEHGIFIYDRDLRKLSQSLASFDAFVCAYTALLSDTSQCAKIPTGFPAASGWVQYPRIAEQRSPDRRSES